MSPRCVRAHSAFTLIELLVVIAIIAILVSLTAAAVMKAMWKIPEVQTSSEITQLGVALQAFMSDYDLSDPPPSKLILREDMAYPPGDPSGTFLRKVFGKNLGASQPFVDWNGDGVKDGPWTLEGEQCLIFYVGGIPNTPQVKTGGLPSPQGFSYNNVNPATPGGKRRGPYFQNFVASRLLPFPSNPLAPDFFVYIDAWKVKTSPKPYAFFSSRGVQNGYALTDCTLLAAAPYFSAPSQFTNPSTYQIISAGSDGTFGATGWSPTSGATGAGADDQANFSSTLLKAGQQ